MFSSFIPNLEERFSQTPSPSPRFSSLCALSVSAFNSPSSFHSGGSSDPCLSPLLRRSASSPALSPTAVQCELSAVSRFAIVDAVDAASNISPVFATLTENIRGRVPLQLFSPISQLTMRHYPLWNHILHTPLSLNSHRIIFLQKTGEGVGRRCHAAGPCGNLDAQTRSSATRGCGPAATPSLSCLLTLVFALF